MERICCSIAGDGLAASSSAMGCRTFLQALKMIIGEAQRAAQSSAAGFRVQRAMDIPTKAKLDVIASLKWCHASLSTALLSKPFPTSETYRESTTLTPTTARSTQSV